VVEVDDLGRHLLYRRVDAGAARRGGPVVSTQVVNYRRRDRNRPRRLVHVGGFVRGLPRLVARCRLFGHRSVIDGTTTGPANRPGYRPSRWVVCDRCGVRPDPQGSLDPTLWDIGDRYTGPTQPFLPARDRKQLRSEMVGDEQPPGPYRQRIRGQVGFEFVTGRWNKVGWQAKVGNGGSEHTLALNLHAGFASLYLHTCGFGEWLVRRFNPVDLESKMTGMQLVGGRLEWQMWAPRDNLKGRPVPWWRQGSVSLRWRDKLLGPRRYTYTDVPGGQTTRVLRLPEGDYLLNLKLQTVTFGRARGRRRPQRPHVAWSALGPGIPTEGPLRGRVFGSGVEVPELSMWAGTWPAEAVAAITVQVSRMRTRYGWEPTGKVPVDVGTPGSGGS
jgi:hypothetical protein